MSLNYLPAVLKNNKHGWQIEYHALNPVIRKGLLSNLQPFLF